MRISSEGPIKITKTTVDSAWRRRAADSRLIIRDKDCRGLALIVNSTTMTWTYAYRPRGNDPLTGRRWPSKTVTLGNPATLSPDDARIEANRMKGQAAAGADPAAERKAKAAEAQRKRGSTLGRLLEEYTRALPTRPKMRGGGSPSAAYVAIETAQVRLALDRMEAVDKPAADLDAATIRKLLASNTNGSNARARFGALSRFMDWCQDAEYIEVNPCTLISRARRPKPPKARSGYLLPDKLAHLWKASDGLREPVWRDLVRFLIAIPCRRSEAARLDWSHIDLAKAEWRQSDKMTKNGEPHRLHLHQLALEVLEARRRAQAEVEAEGDPAVVARILATGVPMFGLIFPAPVSGSRIDTFSAIKAKLDKAAEVNGWTWHDFRRSFASALGEAGIPEAVADAILNHRQAATRGGVLGVYQRSSRWPEQVRAMQLWGQLLLDAIHHGCA